MRDSSPRAKRSNARSARSAREARALVADLELHPVRRRPRARSTTSPSPWRSALSTRLPSAWRSRSGSPMTPSSAGASTRIARPRSAARSANRSRAPSSRARTLERLGRTGRRPSAARARTRRSSASCARWSHSSTAATSASRTSGPSPPVRSDALELGLDHRDRRAELVAGVGDEAPLALEGPPQPVEHLVERLAEPADLVAAGAAAAAARLAGQRDSAARRRIASTGRSPAVGQRVAEQPTRAGRAIGPPTANDATRPASASLRSPSDCAHHDDPRHAAVTRGLREHAGRRRRSPAGGARPGRARRDAPPQLRAGSSAGRADGAERDQHAAAGRQQLREALVALADQPGVRRPERRAAREQRRAPRVMRASSSPVDRVVERRRAAHVDEQRPRRRARATIASANAAVSRTRIGSRLTRRRPCAAGSRPRAPSRAT